MARTPDMIDYIEFPAGDLGAVQSFYGKAFGWTFQDYGPAYAAPLNAGIDGGFQSDPAEKPAKPLVILYSLDLTDSRARIVAAGGAIMRDIFAFPGGHRFHFRDPSGNELAVWSDR